MAFQVRIAPSQNSPKFVMVVKGVSSQRLLNCLNLFLGKLASNDTNDIYRMVSKIAGEGDHISTLSKDSSILRQIFHMLIPLGP